MAPVKPTECKRSTERKSLEWTVPGHDILGRGTDLKKKKKKDFFSSEKQDRLGF